MTLANVLTKSKLCPKWLRSSGIECQHSGEFLANIDMTSNIGNEEDLAKQSIFELGSVELEVEYLTSDPDCTFIIQGPNGAYANGETTVEPQHLLDTHHVSYNLRKFI